MFREATAPGVRRSVSGPPVKRRTVTEEVLDRLRELLLNGVLRPGTRIDQAELAVSFGVSTVPVREALLRLQSAGLVEVVPHRGVFVSEVSVEELLDIYTTRELLEEQAARLAIPNLTAADVATLGSLAKAMQGAAGKGQLDELLSLNREFHFTIYRAAKRRHLLQLIDQLWDLSTRYAHLQVHTVPDRASETLYEIRSIVSACERKDVDALGWMIRYKVHQTTAGLLQHRSLPDVSVNLTAQFGADLPKKTGGSKKTSPA
jgi:DNA-binding GntR family transcriptional regulator